MKCRNFGFVPRQLLSSAPVFLALLLVSVSLVAQPSADNQSISTARVTDQRIRFFQMQLARDPDYYANYDHLASAYALKGRETGDITYYELAEKALKKSLELEWQHSEAAAAWSQLGAVQFAEHRFAEAASSAERALRLEDDPSARALAGDAQLEMGNLAEAEGAFAKLSSSEDNRPRPGSEYLSCTRRAALAWMRGDVATAMSLMQQATTLAPKAHLPAENVAWTHFMLGEQSFLSGDMARAESEMKSSLAAFPSYHRALAGMGQLRAAQHRYDDAAKFYQQAIAIIPLPIYASSLGDIYRRMGKDAEAEKQYVLVEYIGRLGTLNKQIYNRDLALFFASHDRHLPEALSLAEKELEVRHDVYTWDALAWALLKNGRPAEAQKAIAKALAAGTREPLLFFHAAAIERGLGNMKRSSQYAQEAVALNPQFHVIYADQARQWLLVPAQTTDDRGARASN